MMVHCQHQLKKKKLCLRTNVEQNFVFSFTKEVYSNNFADISKHAICYYLAEKSLALNKIWAIA
jgi:hypothetical protein